MARTGAEIIAHYRALLTLRAPWEPTWDRIGRLVLPRKSGLQFGTRMAGQRVENQYTSVAIRANELLAASMQGSLTSSVLRWFALQNGLPKLEKNKAVAEWYEKFSDRLWSNLARSNFHQEMQETYLDLGAFGTGCIFMDEKKTARPGFGGFRFSAQEIGTYAIAEDGEGHVDTVYRILKMSPRAAAARWGKRKIGDRLQKMLADPAASEQMVDILHGVYPREGAGAYKQDTPARKLPVASCYVDHGSGHIIDEGGFHEMAAFVPRWTKVSGETWGRGPGFTALGDVSTMDEATKLNLQAWAFAIRPAYLRRHDGVVGNPKIMPGSYVDVYDMEALKPLESGQNVQINQIESERLMNDIRNGFFWEQLQLPNQQIYTATEVQRRMELMQRVLGPTLGRLEVELLGLVIMRGAMMMMRAGEISKWLDPLGAPQPPAEILEALADGLTNTDIQYLGPLARAQKTADVDTLNAALAAVTPVVQMKPNAAMTMNEDEIVRFIFNRRGLPTELLNSPAVVKQATEEATKQAQREQQQQQMLNMSNVAKNAAPLMQSPAAQNMDDSDKEAAQDMGVEMAGAMADA